VADSSSGDVTKISCLKSESLDEVVCLTLAPTPRPTPRREADPEAYPEADREADPEAGPEAEPRGAKEVI